MKLGTVQRRLPWLPRKDDTHKSRGVINFRCPYVQKGGHRRCADGDFMWGGYPRRRLPDVAKMHDTDPVSGVFSL